MNAPARAGRGAGELRPVHFELGAAPYAEGSCIIAAGMTRVLCTASVEESVPEWRKGAGAGWVTAEYAMLPRSTHTRTGRERTKLGGRTQEIQRLIGRALRAATELEALGERTVLIDCDVLVADGGTRTAAITGAAVALHEACSRLVAQRVLESHPMHQLVAATSVGTIGGEARLDLEYAEDVIADVDMNVVCLEAGTFVEVQGTGEHGSFSRTELDALLDLAMAGMRKIFQHQKDALGL